MLSPLVALLVAAAPAPAAGDSPFTPSRPAHVRLVQAGPSDVLTPPPLPGAPSLTEPHAEALRLERVTLRDAPVGAGTAFAVSAVTGLTGLLNLFTLFVGPPLSLPGSELALHGRIATSLLLMSVGPSMGDLLVGDGAGFLIGAGGRTLIAALGYGTVMALQGQWSRSPAAVVLGVLFTTALGFGWVGWGLVDLVRSAFAPQRWVDRENRARQLGAAPDLSRRPPSAVPGEPGLFRM